VVVVVWAVVAGAARCAHSAQVQGRRSARNLPNSVPTLKWTGCSNTCSELLRVAILKFYCWISNADYNRCYTQG
jgi:hypothetical protein